MNDSYILSAVVARRLLLVPTSPPPVAAVGGKYAKEASLGLICDFSTRAANFFTQAQDNLYIHVHRHRKRYSDHIRSEARRGAIALVGPGWR